MNRTQPTWVSLLCWVCLALALAWTLIGIPLTDWNPLVLFILTVPISLTLSVRRYGVRAALVFWISSIVISNLLENISILTGFPFGFYHYTGGPKIFFVPVMIGPIYASLGYLSWTVANTLLGEADRRIDRAWNVFVLPLVSGAVMTMWDLVTDPQASTFGQGWIWRDGGNFFGVPETNFVGWWFVTYLFFQVFALYIRRQRLQVASDLSHAGSTVPVLFYIVLGLSVPMDFLAGSVATATDAAGVVWRKDHLLGTMTIVMLFTMLFVGIVALHRNFERRISKAADQN